MKNVYLNSVLLSRFYLQTIQKTKNTTKIIITKISKSKKKNTEIKKGESYLLILLKTTIKTIKNCLRKHRRREDEWEEPRKNKPWRGVRFYTAFLLTDFSMELKIIFSWAVALNSVGIFLNFAIKFWKSLQIFRSPSAHPSVNRCQSTCALDLPLSSVIPSVNVPTDLAVWQSHTLEFALFVGDFIGKRIDVCGMGCNLFATPDKIPTGKMLSVWPSMIAAKYCNFFATLGKIPTGHISSIYPSVIVEKYCNVFATLGKIPSVDLPVTVPRHCTEIPIWIPRSFNR